LFLSALVVPRAGHGLDGLLRSGGWLPGSIGGPAAFEPIEGDGDAGGRFERQDERHPSGFARALPEEGDDGGGDQERVVG
jgi:hypothetical protein